MPLGAAPTLDINHPAYARANALGGSGWQQRPTYLDLDALLAQDPMLQGQLRQIGWGYPGQGALGYAEAPLDERYRQALISYGGVPSGVQIDNTTRQLAEDATTGGLSTLAQLRHAYALANSQSTGAVAARGLGRSGAIGQHLMENLRGYDVNRATAQANLMNSLAGIQQERGNLYQTALGQAQTATTNAIDRIYNDVTTGVLGNPRPVQTVKNTYDPRALVAAAPNIPRTDPKTFQPTKMRVPTYGQGRNRFAINPGRGRLPIGGYGVP